MSAPIVSIVVPAYNGAAWLPATLDSLAGQSFTNFEVLVIDDCSTDGTRELVRAWPDARVRLIEQQKNGGPVRARNRGVAEARGRYIAGLDQDDLCRPERLARQVAYLERHTGCALLGTDVFVLRGSRVSRSGYPSVTTPGLISWLLWIENPLAWSSVMVRGDVARALDPFTRPERLYAEDFDLYGRALAWGEVARLDEPLIVYRAHSGGASKRFTATMHASAATVLAERHAGVLGDDAASAAALLVRHVMEGEAVPDRALFAELGALLTRLQAAFLAAHAPDAETTRLIRWETAARWARIGRAGLRAGTLTLADVLAVRPDHLGLGHAGLEALAMAGLVGGGRRMWRGRG